MTFLEAAHEILKREGKPLHFKELTERAMTKKLLTFVGRTPELTMQTQLTAAIKKAPGNPFVRVKPGTFGLLRYPEMAPEEVPQKPVPKAEPAPRSGTHGGEAKSSGEKVGARSTERKKDEKPSDDVEGERGRRRRRRGGRGTREGKELETESPALIAAKANAKAAPQEREKPDPRPDPRDDRKDPQKEHRKGSSAARASHAGEQTRLGYGEPEKLEAEKSNDRSHHDGSNEHPDEHMDDPSVGGMSAEARAAALAETGVLEGDAQSDDGDGDDDETDDQVHADDQGNDESNDELDDRTFASTPAELPAVTRSARAPQDRTREDQGPDGKDDQGGAERTEPQGQFTDGQQDEAQDDDDDDDDDEVSLTDDPAASAFGERAPGSAAASDEASSGDPAGDLDDPARRRRRRRRRRRGVNGDAPAGDDRAGATPAEGGAPDGATPSPPPASDGPGEGQQAAPAATGVASSSPGAAAGDTPSEANGQSTRKILAPIDAAIEVLRGQPPGRGVHVRQIADSAIRKRLIHGEPNEAWRVIRTALATEPKHRLRNGTRPRVRSAGSGLFTLARRPPEAELEKAEHVFGEARRALRERTMAALEKRVAELPPGAFEALARVLLQREGFGPTTFVKRVDGTIYVEALRGRGSRPSRCLIALRAGGTSAGRRAIGELRAGIRARNQDEGVLMLCGRLADDGISEWKQPGPPLEIVDGAALAETCVRHGVGVQTATVTVDFVDGDFFAELSEG
jgi:hypothetical protein